MTELKACYKCGKSDEVIETSVQKKDVKLRGKLVTYQHEGLFCKRCKRSYDEIPKQTEANEEKMWEAWKDAPLQERKESA